MGTCSAARPSLSTKAEAKWDEGASSGHRAFETKSIGFEDDAFPGGWLLVPSCPGAAMVQLERKERQPTGFSPVLPPNLVFWMEYPLSLQTLREPGVISPLRLLVPALPGKAREDSCRVLRILSSIWGLFHSMDQKQDLVEEPQGSQAPD